MTAVVVGGGIAGLVAARRLAASGRDVLLLERSAQVGGRVARLDLDGTVVDGGAESFAVRGGVVVALLEALGLSADVVDPIPGGAWVALADRTVPLPAGGVLGIPASPLAADVQRAIGGRAAARAYLDRVLPVLHVGRYDRLGPLVRARMGRTVLDRLVAPVVESVYGVDAETVPVDAIVPQLNEAITATGALSGAVERLRAASPAGSAVQGLRGGLFRLAEALTADLRARGVEIRTGTSATGLHRGPVDGLWTVDVDGGDPIDAVGVVVAVDGAAAFDLLAETAPAVAEAPRPDPVASRVVVLVVDDARLDARPRGSGVLRAAGRAGIRATALTHLTGKWAWLRDGVPAGRHVLRLSYRGGEAVSDATVLTDASALLGLALPQPAARVDAVWIDTAPPLAPRTLALRPLVAAAVTASPGLAVTGSWRTGTGLASVIAGAERAAGALHGG